MEVKNINKSQLAKVLSIPSMSIGRWVNGKVTDPSLSKLQSLSKFFEVGIDDLVSRNLEVQDEVAKLYTEYINIPVFEWGSGLIALEHETVRTKRVPKILNIGEEKDIFSIYHPSEYYGIYPKNAILVFSKYIDIELHDVLLVRNKTLNTLLFIRYNEKCYKSVLTHEKVDIEQYKIEGILLNIILDNVFLNLPE
jgi:transcriptional regulator with XRE-family HTH domain